MAWPCDSTPFLLYLILVPQAEITASFWYTVSSKEAEMRSWQKDVLRKVSFKLRPWLILFCQCLDSLIEESLFWRVTGLNLGAVSKVQEKWR